MEGGESPPGSGLADIPHPKLLLGVPPQAWTSGKEQLHASPHGCAHTTRGALWAVSSLYWCTQPLLLPPESQHSPASHWSLCILSVQPEGMDSPTPASTGLPKAVFPSLQFLWAPKVFSPALPLACALRKNKHGSSLTPREQEAAWPLHCDRLVLQCCPCDCQPGG